MPLSPREIEIVKSTVPVLEKVGVDITTSMYRILFERHPVAREFFESAERQPAKLAAAIVAYARHVDNLEVLLPVADRIAAAHVRSGVQAEHYALVADALLDAIREVLGAAATDEVISAWTSAFNLLAGILIDRESALYGHSGPVAGRRQAG